MIAEMMAMVERVMTEHEERQAVVEEALSWLGTPYHHMARVRGAGVDCGMFLLEAFHGAGLIPRIDPEPYPHDWHMHREEERYLGWVERFCRRIEGPAKPGDIALYRFGRCISHGAIVTGWPQIVHSYLGRGVLLDDAEANTELSRRFVGFWSFWGGAR